MTRDIERVELSLRALNDEEYQAAVTFANRMVEGGQESALAFLGELPPELVWTVIQKGTEVVLHGFDDSQFRRPRH